MFPASGGANGPAGNGARSWPAAGEAAPRAQVMGASLDSELGFCSRSCGRRTAAGQDRWGQPFDTCCRGCALGQGHEAGCGFSPKEVSGDVDLAMALQLAEMEAADHADDEIRQLEQEAEGRDWPRTLMDPVWGEYELSGQGLVHPCIKQQFFACCPCFMVGCGTEASRRAWKRYTVSWSFSIALLQTFLMVYTIERWGGMVSLDQNPMLGPHYHAFDYMGAKNAARILSKGEWYRLVCPMFLHGGWLHLVGNLLVQLRVGIMLEVMWGGSMWILIYIVSGVYSALASCIMSPEHLGIGSSGALCGLLGAWFAFILITWNQTLPRDIADRNLQTFNVGAALVVIIGMSFLPLMDFAAHFGGLVMGGALAMAVFASRLQSYRWRMATRACGYTSLLALVTTALWWFLNKTEVSPHNLDLCAPPCRL